jgi:uncharacterized protein YcbX
MASNGVRARLASIHIYPLKAAHAVDLDQSLVEPWGMAGDRRWLLVDETGRFVSQREEPTMARVVVRTGDRVLTASARGLPDICIPAPCQEGGAEMLRVSVWSSTLLAAAAGPAANSWFSSYLGRAVRLVYLDDPTRREVDQDFGKAGDVVSFADGYPLLLTNSGSLDALGRWLTEDGDQPVPMNRFRPNVVVAGATPWAEDGWRRVRIGEVTFRVVKPCGRCVVTTIDQATAQVGREPLKMLGRRRRFGQLLVFGQNMIPEAPGVIRVGDHVEILESAE